MLRMELKIASISLAAAAAIASTALTTSLTATIAPDTADHGSHSVVGGKIVPND